MELQEGSKIIANTHVAIVSVKKMRIVRLTYSIVFKDTVMLVYRIRSARMEGLARMGNAYAPKNLKVYIVKNVMSLEAFAYQQKVHSTVNICIYKATVMLAQNIVANA